MTDDINVTITESPDNINITVVDCGTPEWGKITGDIDDQTDLQTELDLKANQSTTYTKTETDNLLATKEPLKSSDDNYVTDTQLIVIQNTSGKNTGDETQSSIINKIGYTPEDISNKATSLSSESTNDEYPSAKCVFDIVGDISATLDAISGEVI